MGKAYAVLSALLSPFMPLWLFWRSLQGKEGKFRWRERLGYASFARPSGILIWLHAASVGEANSVLPLIRGLRARLPAVHLLLTTGTRTSAMLMRQHLPKPVMHQYVPLDTPQASERFMRHWQPDAAFFVESELWPNLVAATDRWQCFLGLINARMSKRSFHFWRRWPAFISRLLACFNVIFAQSEEDADRLKQLGAGNVRCLGNIKYDAAPLPCDESVLLALKSAIGKRPVWLAASTHPVEENAVMQTHALLAATQPDLLTLIVPRHPARGNDIAATLAKRFRVALRSRQDALKAETQCYIADTLGELGIFYRLSDIVFMGGSLVNHGGQNPLEPARLSCAIIAGPHTHNFSDMYEEMEKSGAALKVKNDADLAAQIALLFSSVIKRQTMQAAAKQWVEGKAGATGRLLDELTPLFTPRSKAA